MSILFYIRLALYFVTAIPASVVDVRTYRVPRLFSIGTIFLMVCFYAYVSLSGGSFKYQIFISPLIGAASSFVIYFIARLLTDGGLGWGDILFGIGTGLFCGFPSALFALSFSAIIGILFYLACAIKDRSKNNGKIIIHPLFAIPYIPFISAGAILVTVSIIFFHRY